jgi:hypothetical protein
MVATGPGHAFFFLESANTFFGGSPEANVVGGTRVVVINGHYPMPEEMPGQTILPTAQILSRNDYRRRDLSLIDTSWVLPNDLK